MLQLNNCDIGLLQKLPLFREGAGTYNFLLIVERSAFMLKDL